MNQKEKVMEFLQHHGQINAVEAITYLRVYRLASIIHMLRQDGAKIISVPIQTDRQGSPPVNYIYR
jgi:hypothetical protein